jgi:putative DNA primase/helicase
VEAEEMSGDPGDLAEVFDDLEPGPAPRAGARRSGAEVVSLRAASPQDAAPRAGDIGDFADPVAAATAIVATRYTESAQRRLHYWQGEFHLFAQSHYIGLPMADVREMLYSIGPAVSAKPIKKRTVDDVLDALKAAANLSHRVIPAVPAWIDRQPSDPDPRGVIPVRNGLVHVETGQLLPPAPRLFVPYSLPFEYSADAPPPSAWFAFLASVWGEDRESVETLQEWLGYLLTADTSQQKALMIVGPRRSGKGTIGRVLVQLLGERNVASPTLASLGSNFGLEPLIGRTAALMSDARLGARADIAAVAENLLRLTGEDAISVDRKFREAYTARLLARVVVLTNEVPLFRDAASALPSRFIVLRTDKSFFGREDHGLDGRLAAELPGILVWALDGLRRLRARGRFVQPLSGAAQMRLMEDLASPVSAFLRDACVMEAGAEVPVGKLYEAWREWCREHGRDQPGTEQTFGRDIAAAAAGVGHKRPRINGVRVRMYTGLRTRTPDDPVEGDDDDEGA